MKQRLSVFAFGLGVLATTLLAGVPAEACEASEAIVSTEWLVRHLDQPNLVIVDVRSGEEYGAGHIPNAISIPFAMPTSAWNVMSSGLLMEVPAQAELLATMGNAGIGVDSWVVVVNNTEVNGVPPSYPRAQTTRVADTLLYAGVRKVSILDGGTTKWTREGKPLSTEVVTRTPGVYDGRVLERMFVSKEYVESTIGSARTVLIDARDANVYTGEVVESFAPRPGHIPTALSLPGPSVWNDDGTFKSEEELQALVSALGVRRSSEVIVYCGVGGYASGWWFVLKEVLGYRNVKLYDGSAQEWAADPDAPLVTGAQ